MFLLYEHQHQRELTPNIRQQKFNSAITYQLSHPQDFPLVPISSNLLLYFCLVDERRNGN